MFFSLPHSFPFAFNSSRQIIITTTNYHLRRSTTNSFLRCRDYEVAVFFLTRDFNFVRQQLMRHNRTRLRHSQPSHIIHKCLTCVQNILRQNQVESGKQDHFVACVTTNQLYKRCVLDNPPPGAVETTSSS